MIDMKDTRETRGTKDMADGVVLKGIISKISIILIAAAVMISMTLVFPANTSFAASKKVKHINITTSPTMKTIKLKWKHKKGVRQYVIYRKLVESNPYITDYKMSEYEKIGKVKVRAGKKKYTYKDKKVEKNQYYAYVLKAYKKKKGRKYLAYTSYQEGVMEYDCCGLQEPELLNGGYGENYMNGKNRTYLYVQRVSGVEPSSAVLYRKAKGQSKYKKIKVKKVEAGSFGCGMFYRDSSVKPGKIYYYKAKTVKKKKGKKYYSKASNTVRIPAVNFLAYYDVESVTAPGEVGFFIIKISSAKYNGKLTLAHEAQASYSTEGNAAEDGKMLLLSQYSKGGKTWKTIPAKGLNIKAGQTRYLKFVSSDSENVNFGGNATEQSNLFMESADVEYDGPGNGFTQLDLDLVQGSGTAYMEWD